MRFMMAAFNATKVQALAADLSARFDACDNGEGMDCANLDETMQRYASLSCTFCAAARRWAREIFAGRTTYDAQAEQAWQRELAKLHERVKGLLSLAQESEEACYRLQGPST